MRILVLGDLWSPHVERWATSLADAGHVIACAGFGDPTITGIELHELGSHRGESGFALALPTVRRVVRRFAPEVIHAHFDSSYGVVGALTGGLTPIVHFAWGSDLLLLDGKARWHRAAVRTALRRGAAIVADAADVAERARSLAPAVPVSVTVFGPPASWTTAPRREEPVVLSPRGLKPMFNPYLVLEAFAEATASAAPAWRLEVLTGGANAAGLVGLAARLGVDDRVVFHPRLSRAQLQEAFLRAAIFVSVPTSDGTSVAFLEGMASGAYPIVSDLPANRAWVTDGANGRIVATQHPGQLADALRAAINDEGRLDAAQRNRMTIAAHATWEHAVSSVEEVTQVARARRRR
jgi:glycosyltransferase involved in cell wall biosynthesis